MKRIKISLKRLTAKRLIYIQIVYAAVIKGIASMTGLPSATNYVTDVITVLLLIELLFQRMNGYRPEKPIVPTKLIIGFFIYTIINWIMHLYSPIYYLWGFRNTFRFYIFFVACTIFLEKEDVPKIINIVFCIFIINLIMCSYQFFVLEKKGDSIAGLFGNTNTTGGNGGLGLWSSITLTTTIVQYIENKKSIIKPIVAIVGALYIATIAEIKALYILVGAVVIMASLFTKFSLKKFIVVVAVITAFPVAIKLLYELYPSFENFFEFETIMSYSGGETGYTGGKDIDRFTVIQYCFDNFLKNPIERIFGLGLGAADGSTTFDVVSTEFFKNNYDTHYTWFVTSYVLIENGILGLAMFYLIIVSVFIDAIKLRRYRSIDRGYFIIVQIVSVIMIALSILNQSIRTEGGGYTCYAFLAMPYILTKKE